MYRKEIRNYKVFLLSISLTVVVFMLGIFIGGALMSKNLVHKQVLVQARTLFNSIVMMRRWNASYGGVYVKKMEGTESTPYLDHPDIETNTGTVYTIKVPAVMTREISEDAGRQGLFSFKLSSKNLVNPMNAPDGFERAALDSFEKGEKEASAFVTVNGQESFRYMAPLYIEEACLKCHAGQGYKPGDIRGGISITLNVKDVQEELSYNLRVLVALVVSSSLMLIGVIGLFTMKLIRGLSRAREEIETLAITDSLTGIFNRRHLFERFKQEFERGRRLGEPLGCILIDIDHFKKVNDNYGHLVGDDVPRGMAGEIQGALRAYDLFGRYGGEEFMAVLPDTEMDKAIALAERIRESVRHVPVVPPDAEEKLDITISLGVSCLKDSDSSIDDMIMRADSALYCAKNEGRNRVCSE